MEKEIYFIYQNRKIKFTVLMLKLMKFMFDNGPINPGKIIKNFNRSRPQLYAILKKIKQEYHFVKNFKRQINNLGRPFIYWNLTNEGIDFIYFYFELQKHLKLFGVRFEEGE